LLGFALQFLNLAVLAISQFTHPLILELQLLELDFQLVVGLACRLCLLRLGPHLPQRLLESFVLAEEGLGLTKGVLVLAEKLALIRSGGRSLLEVVELDLRGAVGTLCLRRNSRSLRF
jgi:hypothetical protein